jgi:hypothetical protein
LTYERLVAVEGYILGHGYVYDVAFGFLSAPKLIDQDLGFNINEVAYNPLPAGMRKRK